jgi:hypothetical protein
MFCLARRHSVPSRTEGATHLRASRFGAAGSGWGQILYFNIAGHLMLKYKI